MLICPPLPSITHTYTHTHRRVFERVIHLKLSTKKMKFFFKRYLDFEKACGNDQGVEHVKQAAIAFVESL